ncbi:MAG: phosphoribosylpyrophosphate synthetase [Cryomorphaceae bacterium]|nr:phosphoribosylpyrophosphate synthetase [Flavobacteriales bacterium]
MHKTYDTLSQATDDLRKRGFELEFNQDGKQLSCLKDPSIVLNPDDFEIVEVHRFEGATDPGDTSVVYAVEGKKGQRGVLVDAYGVYGVEYSPEMLKKLDMRDRI